MIPLFCSGPHCLIILHMWNCHRHIQDILLPSFAIKCSCPPPLLIADLNKPGFQFPPEQRALYCQQEKAFTNQSVSFRTKATIPGMLSSPFLFGLLCLWAAIWGPLCISGSLAIVYIPFSILYCLQAHYLIYLENIIFGCHYVDYKLHKNWAFYF